MESGWGIYLPKKNKELNLDKKDLLILETLLENSRATLTTLNKITKLSKVALINRLKKLEKEKIIQGYSTIVNIHNLDYEMITLMIKTKMTLTEKEEFIDYLKQIPFINQTYSNQKTGKNQINEKYKEKKAFSFPDNIKKFVKIRLF